MNTDEHGWLGSEPQMTQINADQLKAIEQHWWVIERLPTSA
jgi:hypothetical protein